MEELNLRDYFAAKVLQGITSDVETWRNICLDTRGCARNRQTDTVEDYAAQYCYNMADAMLKERAVNINILNGEL